MKNTKTTQVILTLTIALILCVSIVIAGTLSALSDTRTARGSITFNLAEYDLFYLDATTDFAGLTPGDTKTDSINVINSYRTGTDTPFGPADPNGVIAGMSGLYLKMTGITVKIGGVAQTVSIQAPNAAGKIVIITSGGLTISLNAAANASKNLYWGAVSNNEISLVSSNGGSTLTTLPFSSKEADETNAEIKFEASLAEASANNGFNAGNGTAINNNQFQGKNIEVAYTLKWATTSTGFPA